MNSHLLAGFDVFKQGTTTPVAADGNEIGELAIRGNMVMKGYLKTAKPPQKPLTVAGLRPVTWASNTPMVTSKLWIGSKTSSSRAARISQVSK